MPGLSRDYRSALKTLGVEWHTVRKHKHPIIEVAHHGKTKRFTGSCTQGDHRAVKNFTGQIRKWIKKVEA